MNFLLEHSHYFIPFSVFFIFITYQTFAQQHGWATGIFFINKEAQLSAIGMVGCLWALIESFIKIKWYSPLVVLVLGYTFCVILANVFKSWVQLVSLVLGIVSFFLLSLPHKVFLKLLE